MKKLLAWLRQLHFEFYLNTGLFAIESRLMTFSPVCRQYDFTALYIHFLHWTVFKFRLYKNYY